MITFSRAQDAAAWLHARGCGRLRSDSRRVQPGDGFIAWSGAHVDARDWVDGAMAHGAHAALVEAQDLDAALARRWSSTDAVAAMPALHAAAGAIADAFYRQPSRALDVLAITGTNGKTSTACWLAQALQALGQPCGVIGTLGMGALGALAPSGLTTPQAVELHDALAAMRDAGLRACALEASSIGLSEGRMTGVHLRLAVFTNLSQDHLDYHADMDAYWQAKRQLFSWLQLGAAVVNIDDAHGAQLAAQLPATLDCWTFGESAQARLRLQQWQANEAGMTLLISERGDAREHRLDSAMIGRYNAANLLAVIASLRALGHDLAQALTVCAQLQPVAGRLQTVAPQPQRPLVVVDYAHTPDAVAQVLLALRPVATARGGRLWCVLGCGGNRDASKRAPMAAAAEQGAECVILTSDNPRDEDPQAILQAMLQGLTRPAHAVCADRGQAIALAVAQAQINDVVVIAGKGHEDYQEVGGRRLPFSDHDVALAALNQRQPQGLAA